jgi:selenide, water dikinase
MGMVVGPTVCADSMAGPVSAAEGGFLAIDEKLQSAGGPPEVFACGDVATSVVDPRPKSGVFAVRQGEPLADNLRRFLTGQPLKPFKPQAAALSLISLGRQRCVVSKSFVAFSGYWLWPVKDAIDRAFIRKFGSDLPQMQTSQGAVPTLS